MPAQTPDPRDFKADLTRRLRCAEGHLRAIARLVETEADCQAILQQLVAVQGALGEVTRRLVKHYLNDGLATDLHASDPARRERALEDVVALYQLISGHMKPRVRIPNRLTLQDRRRPTAVGGNQSENRYE